MAREQLTGVVRQIRKAVGSRADERSDAELLHAFGTRRDEDAFAAIVARYGGMVLSACRRVLGNGHDAEDAGQATFLALARGAARIRSPGALPGWLYGTAHRVAIRAKRAADRRRRREARVHAADASDPVAELMWRELQGVLDAEIDRLPQPLRGAFLLCCLEGVSHAEAGRRLGVAEGSVSSRVSRARQRLHRRLAKRGIELSAVLAALAVGSVARAGLPPAARAALARAVTHGTGGSLPGLSRNVLDLAKGGPRTMWCPHPKLIAGLVLAAGLLGGATTLVPGRASPVAAATAEPTPAAAADRSPAGAPARADAPADRVGVNGRVRGTDGQALAGAELLLVRRGERPVKLGVSGPDGRFRAEIPGDRKESFLVARADGVGADFIDLGGPAPTGPVELRLVRDRVIRGRVIDTQGKPVSGVRVTVERLVAHESGSLEPFLDGWKKMPFASRLPDGVKGLGRAAGSLWDVTTDAEGRFAVAGAGAERLVSLRVHGGGVADAGLLVANRDGFDPKPYNAAARKAFPPGPRRGPPRLVLDGPDVLVVAEPEKRVRGVVTEANTGRPRAGVEVMLARKEATGTLPALSATTDAAGRYEIRGARKAGSYTLRVRSDPAAGLLGRRVIVPDTDGYRPVTADVGVAKGVVVTGRVVNTATGRGVRGFVTVGVLTDNPNFRSRPEYTGLDEPESQETAADGTFRVVTIPGPVLLMGGPDAAPGPDRHVRGARFRPPVPDPGYPQYFPKGAQVAGTYLAAGNGLALLEGNYCKVLRLAPDAATVRQDVLLEPANELSVRVRDADGRPLAGAWVTGNTPPALFFQRPERVETDCCTACGLEAGKPRRMVFFAPGKKLAGTLSLKGDEKGPVPVRLTPCGAVRGRLLGEGGRPVAGVAVDIAYNDPEAGVMHREFVHRSKQVVTDTRGVFVIDELIPGLEFRLFRHSGKRAFEGFRKLADTTFQVEPGRILDVGTIRPTPDRQGGD
jgi:RNA polymerase sigma factor (sigma-70 family)